mgnify:FL=1
MCATSLHPEEFIILKKGNRISIKKIGEFVDSILSDKNKNSKKITEWEALSTDGEKLVFKPITHIHKHKAKDNLIKVKSASGFDSLITKDHEMFSFNEKNKFTAEEPETNKFVAQALN